MERIFAGEVYEVIPQPSGLVFSYCKEANDDSVLVAYKMLSIDNGTVTDVARNIYLLSKFGSNYRTALQYCENYVTAKSLVLPSGRVLVCSEEGNVALIDADGVVAWTGELKYRGFVPSDMAIYKNALWACYSEPGVLLKFNLTTLREELRIGGTRSPFDKPHYIFVDGGAAIISNTGSNELLRVDLGSYTVENFLEFSEPVYSYFKVKDYAFVLMKSGIYVI